MRTDRFDYELPASAIAQRPSDRREAARLLVHDRASGTTRHRSVADLPRLLAPGDLLVANDTRVRAARVEAQRPGGGRTELLFVERLAGDEPRWRALARPAARLRPGMPLHVPGDAASLRAVERHGAEWVVELVDVEPGPDEEAFFERAGGVPLPPYVERPHGPDATDRERYQTVFAERLGAVAAPTAGLHLTRELLAELEVRGVAFATVTLHVGPGTFRPVEVDDPREHTMHAERFTLSEVTAAAIERTRARGGRVVAVGTTCVRTLESCVDEDGVLRAASGETSLFLVPGARFHVVDALLTNFHLPRSTLLMLVCAFAGTERVLGLYAEALERGYRFASYGDAMLLL